MMYAFLANNRDVLIERCKEKVARRPAHSATDAQLKNGIPIFLDQLERTLRAEEGATRPRARRSPAQPVAARHRCRRSA